MSYKETVLRTPGSPFPGADILKISKHVQWGGVNRPNGFQILYRLLDKIDNDVTNKKGSIGGRVEFLHIYVLNI